MLAARGRLIINHIVDMEYYIYSSQNICTYIIYVIIHLILKLILYCMYYIVYKYIYIYIYIYYILNKIYINIINLIFKINFCIISY